MISITTAIDLACVDIIVRQNNKKWDAPQSIAINDLTNSQFDIYYCYWRSYE